MTVHKCDYYEGQIKDVLLRTSDNTMRCRRCYKQLDKSQIDSQVLNYIKAKKR